MIDWQKIRDDFPVLKNYVYLDAGESSPIPTQVAEAGKSYYETMQNLAVLGWTEWDKIKEHAREKLARLINAEPKEIAFIVSTSYGMNLLADMLLGKGEMLTMEDEYPASTIPWIHKGFKVHFVKPVNQTYPPELIKQSLTKETKILVTSHVQYLTGFCQDLEEIGRLCQERGLIYVVNPTQSLGAIPLDVKKAQIDFMSFSNYKWGLAGFGIGAIYINQKWLGKIKFPQAGSESVTDWNSFDNAKFTLKKDASELEVGTASFPNILALNASLDYLNQIGMENIQQRIYELTDYLISGLQKRKIKIVTPLEKKYRSGIIIIDIPNPEKICQELEKRKIIVSKRNKGLRISVHFYNSKEDIDKFLSALEDRFYTEKQHVWLLKLKYPPAKTNTLPFKYLFYKPRQ